MTLEADLGMGAGLADLALRVSGPLMIIGAGDAGKSTLARSLVLEMLGAGRRAALVDSDLGQTQVGPPTAVGLALFEGAAGDLRPIVPAAMAFVGDTSPAGRLLETALAAWKMSTLAAALGAAAVVINTGGLVLGPHGRRLKLAKAELIRPEVVLALERRGELEHLISALERRGISVVRLPVPPGVRAKRPEERRHWRQERFRAYFAGARTVELEAGGVLLSGRSLGGGPALSVAEVAALEAWLRAGVVRAERQGEDQYVVLEELPSGGAPPEGSLRVAEAASFRRLLAGLIDREGICLALGLIEDLRRESLEVLTPLSPEQASEVSLVELGELGLDEEFREFRPASPWVRLSS